MRRALFLMLLLLVALPAWATTAVRYDNIALNQNGKPLTTVSVAVYPTSGANVFTVSTATSSGYTSTITTTAPHGFTLGQTVSVADVLNDGYNGIFTITGVPTTTSFTYTNSYANLTPSSGGMTTVTLATLYTARDEATTSNNPFTTDLMGNYGFWADAGYYVVQIYTAGIVYRTMDVFVFCDPTIGCVGSNQVGSGPPPAFCIAGQTYLDASTETFFVCDTTNTWSIPAQNSGTSSPPATCTTGEIYIDTTTQTLYVCDAPNTWSIPGVGNGAGPPPSTCTTGQIYIDTAAEILYVCDAPNTWSVPAVQNGTTPPSSCTPGELFVNTSDYELYICKSSGTFTLANNLTGVGSPVGVVNCSPGQIFIDTASQTLYVCEAANTWSIAVSNAGGTPGSTCTGPAPYGTVCSAPYSIIGTNIGVNQVAHGEYKSTGETSQTITLSQPIVAGDLLLVGSDCGSCSLTATTFADTAGNAFAAFDPTQAETLATATVTASATTETITMGCVTACHVTGNDYHIYVYDLVNAASVHAKSRDVLTMATSPMSGTAIAATQGDLLINSAAVQGGHTDSRALNSYFISSSVPTPSVLYNTSGSPNPITAGLSGAPSTGTYATTVSSPCNVGGSCLSAQALVVSVTPSSGVLTGPNSYKVLIPSQVPGGGGAALMGTTQKLLASDVSLSGDTVILTQALTMPTAGCPCRVLISYSMYASGSGSGTWRGWVTDGTSYMATTRAITTDASSPSLANTEMSTTSYANGQTVTFVLHATGTGSITAALSSGSTENTHMTLTILPSAN